MKIQWQYWGNILLNLITIIGFLITLWLILIVFMFASFKIPSNSMEPELASGDNILVWKPIIGARLFNVFALLKSRQTKIYRLPGIRKVKRNDVLVFNFPHPNKWDKIEMHLLKYYVKRCIGIPGDSLAIKNGFFYIKGVETLLGNQKSQEKIAITKTFKDGIFYSFPYDSIMGWNIKEFGPLYIPAKGDSILLNRTNFHLYKKIIEWEQLGQLEYRDCVVYLKGKPIKGYRFHENYYFMAGDNGIDSQDSRYWGLLPEEYIVGCAILIWKSTDPYTGSFRWNRFIKWIH